MSLKFKVYRGGELIGTEEYDRDIIKIGRLSSAHLRLEDVRVSRIHAVVEVSAGGDVNIIDMGSSEGTFVNGEKVNKASLKHGDEIQLGDTRLVYLVPGGAEPEETAPRAEAEPPGEEAVQAEEGFDAPDLGEPEEEEQQGYAESAPVHDVRSAEPPSLGSAGVVDKYAQVARQRVETAAPPPVPQERPPRRPEPEPPVDERAAGYADEVYSYRVALPPPKELGELDDDERVSHANWALEVRQLWGTTVLDVKYFRADSKKVTIGDQEGKVDFFFPAEGLPDRIFPVARMVGQEAVLSFNSTATGELVDPDGNVTPLQDLARGARVGQDPEYGGCRTFTLPQGAQATLMFGHVGLRIRYVSKPVGFLSHFTDQLDYTFLNTILLMLFVFAAMVATFHLRPKSVETSEEELYKVPDRFVQFILTRPKPAREDLNFLEKLKSDIDGKKADSAPRYKGQEGKMGMRGKPDTGRRSAVRAIKRDDKEIVGNRGLLAVLGAGGPQGLSTVMGGTGLGGELEGAIGGMFGSQIGDSGGFGGLGLKGTGTGGGGVGNTIGVGRLGTSGRGGGRYGYGTGVSKIRRRGERNVNIAVGRPIIMGSLSMEIIRRVIHSHRDQIKYCYSQELTRNPNLSGKVSIKFTISPKGYVQSAKVSSSSLNNATVERCITGKIRTWKFPEPKGGGIVIVNYPFILKSQ
ncbi:MAG: AgmX/PglI C-terminal domain-containing protein [Deltaproteobacteria bacterium]|nr:AgmX/PglI C-terminal domain-containing protein [Deltaproteobacteria bacterium]